MKYYVDISGNYLGAFSDENPAIPGGAIEVANPPADVRQVWNGSSYDPAPIDDTRPRIFDLLDDRFKKGDHRDINFKRHLKNNKYLQAIRKFSIDGLIGDVEYYDGYVDDNDKGDLTVKVEHVWDVDTVEPIPAARNIKERTSKKFTWYNRNGGANSSFKIKGKKKYITDKEINDEGIRRRNNIMGIAQTNIGAILVLNGSATDQADAEDKMIDLFKEYNSSFSTYIKSGKGPIYGDLENDTTFTWLDNDVGATAAGYLGLDSSWNTKKVWEYSVDKLKGLV